MCLQAQSADETEAPLNLQKKEINSSCLEKTQRRLLFPTPINPPKDIQEHFQEIIWPDISSSSSRPALALISSGHELLEKQF